MSENGEKIVPEKKWPAAANLIIEEGNAVRRADQGQVAIVGSHVWILCHFLAEPPRASDVAFGFVPAVMPQVRRKVRPAVEAAYVRLQREMENGL